MGFFSGIGRALGAGAQGFGLGQRQGEQEAYNRFKTDELLNAKLALEHQRQVKEDVPYPIKSLLDTNKAVYASGNHQAINDWEASGHASTARQVEQAYALGGPQAATKAFAVVTQPVGTDVSGLMGGFQGLGGGGLGATAAAPSTPASRLAAANAPPSEGPFNFLHPSIVPDFQYSPSAKETAQTGLLGAQQYQIEALTPENVARIRAQTQDIGDQFGLQQRQQNLKLAQDNFNNLLKRAQFLTSTGQKDFALQSGVYQNLLEAAGHLAVRGVDTSKALQPLLFNTEAGGVKTLNPAVVSMYLQQQGLNQDEINRVLVGGNARAGGGALGLAPPGAAGGVVPGFGGPVGGGVPVLPAVGGAQNPQLAGAQQFTTGQGFTVTSATGGRHNTGSAHYQGRAIDVGVRNKSPQEMKEFELAARQAGYTVRDERRKPKGQKEWSGPHYHLEWGKQGPPAALPGMTQEQVAGLLAPDAGLTATGVNTPGTAPKVQNPWATHPESLESQIFDAYTGANGKQQVPAGEIQRRFAGTPDEGKVAAVIAAANQLTQGNLMNGVPGPSRLGAEVPNAPDLSGLGYPNVGSGVPAVTTTPVPEPNVGFGGAPTSSVELPPTPAPTATTTPGPVTITEQPRPAPATRGKGGPSLTSMGRGKGLKIPLPRFKLPDLQMPAGPPLTGMPPGAPDVAGPDVSKTPKFQALLQGANSQQIAVKPPTGLDPVADEVARYQQHPIAPGIRKWFSAHKVTDPAAQRQVYQYAIGEVGPEVLKQGKTESWLRQNIFAILNKQLKPSS